MKATEDMARVFDDEGWVDRARELYATPQEQVRKNAARLLAAEGPMTDGRRGTIDELLGLADDLDAEGAAWPEVRAMVRRRALRVIEGGAGR